jgi:hypothetical protein
MACQKLVQTLTQPRDWPRARKPPTTVLSPPDERQRHYSYQEDVDEPAGLLEDEAVDIETEAPAEENEPVEQVESDDEPPAFEE